MIRFACPTCKTVLESPDKNAGQKILCPSCGQRLELPYPSATPSVQLGGTVLAVLTKHQPEGPSQAVLGVHQQAGPPQAIPVTGSTACTAQAPQAIPPSQGQTAHAAPMPTTFRVSGRFLAIGGVILIALVILAFLLFRPGGTAGVNAPEDRPNPRTAEEELVKRYILATARKPEAVRFFRWGPHMGKKEVRSFWREIESYGNVPDDDKEWQQVRNMDAMIRVRYSDFGPRFTNDENTALTYDGIFMVMGKKVEPLGEARAGGSNLDAWKEKAWEGVRTKGPALNKGGFLP